VNTKRVNTVADAIDRAQKNGKRTPAGIAVELESAQLLMSPEVAAELEQLRTRVAEVERKYTFDTADLKRQLDSARVDGQRLIRAEQRRAELEAVLATHRKDDQAEIGRLQARVADLTEALSVTTGALRENQAELEAPARVREVPDGEFYAYVHHDHRLGHDLPETGGVS
jgi:chromosome segregation ATPase